MDNIKNKYKDLKTVLQYKKASQKINMLYNYIDNLFNYNNTDDYNNYKNFKIIIQHYCDRLDNDTYNYSIKVYRGLNNPKKCFETRFTFKERLDDLIYTLGEKLVNNKNYYYSSFKKNMTHENRNLEFSNYIINLKKGISIDFNINTEKDLNMFLSLEKKVPKTNKIIGVELRKSINIDTTSKDEIQLDKAKKKLDNVDNLFESIFELNLIEDYNNKKPFTLQINNYYDNLEKCYKFSIFILRGSEDKEELYKTTLKIKDKESIYKYLDSLMLKYMNKNEHIYNSISTEDTNKEYSVKLNNDITINFEIADGLDNEHFLKFDNEYNKNIIKSKKL